MSVAYYIWLKKLLVGTLSGVLLLKLLQQCRKIYENNHFWLPDAELYKLCKHNTIMDGLVTLVYKERHKIKSIRT